MTRSRKTAELKVRVDEGTKAEIVALAAKRKEGESVILREAISAYLIRERQRRGVDYIVPPIAPLMAAEDAPKSGAADTPQREDGNGPTPPVPRPGETG